MTKPAASIKTQAGRLAVVRIVRKTARVVGYLLASLALVAAVSSCAATWWEPFDCNDQPEVCL